MLTLGFVAALAFVGVSAQSSPRVLEYFFDTDPGYGKAARLSVSTEDNHLVLNTSGLAPGAHVLYVRAQDTKGLWSATMAHPLLVSERQGALQQVEYFFDTDPGYGKASKLSVEEGSNALTLNSSQLPMGAHVLYVRGQDAVGHWSTTLAHPLLVADPYGISRLEYFIDAPDPGIGNGVAVVLPQQSSSAAFNFSFGVPTGALALGEHLLNVRAMSYEGEWTDLESRPFVVVEVVVPEGPLTVEYFLDTDPGYGKARQIGAHTGVNRLALDVSDAAPGAHVLYVRSLDEEGLWSATLAHPLLVVPVKPTEARRMEYFVDADPGYGKAKQVAVTTATSQVALDLSGIATGAHVLYMRSQDDRGNWSTALAHPLYVAPVGANVKAVEYFFDNNDPGEGKAMRVNVTPSADNEVALSIATTGLTYGSHQLSVRAMDDKGRWSLLSSEPFRIIDGGATGIVTMQRELPVSMVATTQACILKAEGELMGDCQVDITTVGGVRIASEMWTKKQSALTVPINVSRGTVLIVSINDRKNHLHAVHRIIVR